MRRRPMVSVLRRQLVEIVGAVPAQRIAVRGQEALGGPLRGLAVARFHARPSLYSIGDATVACGGLAATPRCSAALARQGERCSDGHQGVIALAAPAPPRAPAG